MKRGFPQAAVQYETARKRKKWWYRILTVLAAVVVFGTTYALILPAITMENTCPIPEHCHTDVCYAASVQQREILVCSRQRLDVHTHTETCYDYEGHLCCGYADFVVHVHDALCYDDTGALRCSLPEVRLHTHDASCYTAHAYTETCGETENDVLCDPELVELSCELEPIALHTHQDYVDEETPGCYDAEGNLVCGQMQVEEHQHSEGCFEWEEVPEETQVLICGMIEHIHDETCVPSNTETGLRCRKEEHLHTETCCDETGQLVCELEEHTHDENCDVETTMDEETARIGKVISMIDALPAAAQVQQAMDGLEEDAQAAYMIDLTEQVWNVYIWYEDLGPELTERVTNQQKILELTALCSLQTLEETDHLKICQVNGNVGTGTALAYSTDGKTVGATLGNGMNYTYWTEIVVESQDGHLKVTRIYSQGTADGLGGLKKNITVPETGFVILVHESNALGGVQVGNYVSVDFDYTQKAYNANGLGTATFADAPFQKAEKDNSGKLTVIEGASTRGIIEVNLYDYNSRINEMYQSNPEYPVFQQDGGQRSVSGTASSNFGNNVTADLAAGLSNVAKPSKDNINGIVDGANSPLSGKMSSRLSDDGYPVLANGLKLDYLWRNSEYATKVNSQSVDGLFQYDAETGAYTFNSRQNHAQYNPQDDTFTLYEQMISSNFIWYPFGNFLPFNDIVHESAQTSTIDRDYLQTIASTAAVKYSQSGDSVYQTLATALKDWIAKMDEKYPGGWSAAQAMNEYFNSTGAPGSVAHKTFDFTGNALLDRIYSIDFDETTDFYFGMEMKMDFMQPKSGLTGKSGTTPMVFEFSGDDDVWVYIDGILVLDLSGIHRHVGGMIDFTTGNVYYQSLDVATGDVGDYQLLTTFQALGLKTDSSGRLEDYSTHQFHFYYMERGAGSGVCRMNFNFPVLRKNSLSVTKEISVDDQSVMPLLGNPDFQFQALREDGSLFIGSGVSYEILDSEQKVTGNGVTDENGIFVLKAGQTARFGVAENAGRYYVRELLDAENFTQYGTICVSGSTRTENYGVEIGGRKFTGVDSPLLDISDGATVFLFNNQVDTEKLGNIRITKTLSTYTGGETQAQFRFCVLLDGEPVSVGTVYQVGDVRRTVEEGGIITLAPDETAVLSGILAGTRWSVRELEEDAANYHVTYTVDGQTTDGIPAGTIRPGTAAVTVMVHNSERGATVEIPVRKILKSSDDTQHIYTFRLIQVTDETGQTEIPSGMVQTQEIKLSAGMADACFAVSYPGSALQTLPQRFYYRISEELADEPGTEFDKSVYIVEVTVTSTDGSLSAAITNRWKDGQKMTETDEIEFVNWVIAYELPETGGSGTRPYIVGGVLLILAAAWCLLDKKRQCGKEDPSS